MGPVIPWVVLDQDSRKKIFTNIQILIEISLEIVFGIINIDYLLFLIFSLIIKLYCKNQKNFFQFHYENKTRSRF